MEKPTCQDRDGPPGGRVAEGRLVGTVLLGLFWFAAGVVATSLLVAISVATFGGDRPPPKQMEAVALGCVSVVCLGPAAVAAFGLAVWHWVVWPARMLRSARSGS